MKKLVLNGADYVPTIRTVVSVVRVADLVGGDEGGIGAVSRSFVRSDGRNRIVETARIDQPLAFVTNGEPAGKVKAVIEAFQAAASK